MEAELITTEYLTKIETALNIPAGHNDVSPQIRLEGILQAIQNISHRAGFVLNEKTVLLNRFSAFMDVITVDFSQFEEDVEEYEKEWDSVKESYARRRSIK